MGKTHSYGSHMRFPFFIKNKQLYDKTISFCGPADSCICPFNAAEIFTGYDIDAIVAKMSLEQKARLLVGSEGKNDGLSHIVPGAAGWTYEIPALGIPSINLADGPVGVRINPVPSHDVKTE